MEEKHLTENDIRIRLQRATWNRPTSLVDLFNEIKGYCETNARAEFGRFFGSLPPYISSGELVSYLLILRRDVLGFKHIYDQMPVE